MANTPEITPEELKALQDKMNELAAKIPFPVKIYDANGNFQLSNAIRVLQGNEFKSWREAPENAALLKNLKQDLGIDITKTGMGMSLNLMQAAFGVGEMVKASKIDTSVPRYPSNPGRNQNLDNALEISGARANRGMSSAERLSYENSLREATAGQLNSVRQATGGQGSATAAVANSLGSKTADANLKFQGLNSDVQRKNFNDYLGATNADVQQGQFNASYDARAFEATEKPAWEQRIKDRGSLMSAGIENLQDGVVGEFAQANNFLDRFYAGRPNDLISSGNIYVDRITESAQKVMDARDNIAGLVNPIANPSEMKKRTQVTY